jgi:transcriptional regulator with XRE-family HTH domain
MLQRFLDSLKDEDPILPNSFTLKLGELIRLGRLEAKLSQADLARLVYLRQSSISNIEKGTRAVSTEELMYIMFALNKPINYFFPRQVTQEITEQELTVLEKELIIQARRLNKDDLRRLTAQAQALAELAPSTDNFLSNDHKAIAESLFKKPVQKRRKKK